MRAHRPHVLAWVLVAAAAAVLWAHELPVPGTGRLDTHAPFTLTSATRVPLTVLTGLLALLLLWRGLAARRADRAADDPPAPDLERDGWRPGPATDAPAAGVRLPAPVRTPSRVRTPPVLAPLALLVVAVAAAVQVAPRVVGSGPVGSSGGGHVTVLSANVLRSEVRPAAIVALVRRTKAQAVALPEANAVTARTYERAIEAAIGTRWTAMTDSRGGPDDDPSATSTSLLTRTDLRAKRLGATWGTGNGHGAVRVRLRARGIPRMILSAVHPLAPVLTGSQAGWRANVLALRPRCEAGEVLVGDFNATLDHSPLRSLLAAGCTDAAAALGKGLRATWTDPTGLIRPAIDHVLTSGPWRAVRAGVLPLDGSDHRAIWARVETR